MYDFANQAYTTLIITVIYGAAFTRVIVGDEPDFRLVNLRYFYVWFFSVSLLASTCWQTKNAALPELQNTQNEALRESEQLFRSLFEAMLRSN